MKKSHFYLLLLICLLGCTDSNIVNLKSNEVSTRVSNIGNLRIFEFPDIQWSQFDTYQQRIDACQVPDTLLATISTAELVIICMEYPLLMDAYAHNTLTEGVNNIISNFNGFTELLKRKDNCVCVYDYLTENSLKPSDFNTFDEITIGNKTLRYALGEMLLSLENILKNADNVLKQNIAAFSFETLESKEMQSTYCGLISKSTSAFLCANALSLKTARSASQPLNILLSTGSVQTDAQLQEVKELCRSLIQK